jgi:endoglucanase
MKLLQALTAAFGPSGREDEIRRLIAQTARPWADEIREDTLGSLIVRRRGSGPEARKIMIAAHMDEIGVLITHIDEEGFLRCAPVGAFNLAKREGQRLRLAGGLNAVLARQYLEPGREKPENHQYYLDTGLTKAEVLRAGVQIGDMAVAATDFYETERTVTAKALDNRLGCYVLLETLRQVRSPHDLYFVFTAQEEVGSRGAKTAAFALEPDLALSVDTTPANDLPRTPVVTMRLGAGPAVKVMDAAIVVAPALKDWLARLATENGIDFQWEILRRGGTDAGPIHLSRGGVPTAGIALPVRYLHSQAETAAKEDARRAVKLLVKSLETVDHV